LELFAFQDGTNLYIMIEGESENNFNNILFFVDISSQDGVDAGTALPSGTDGQSPFSRYSGTIQDFETDFGVRIGVGNQDGAPVGFVSIVDFRTTNSEGNAPEQFLDGPETNGAIPGDGTPITFTEVGDFSGTVAAYDDTDLLSNVTTEGFEISIPLSALDWNSGDTFRLFALYVSSSGDFVSANTLPEIPGQSGNNLGETPDFTGIAGDQFTAPAPLPVELAGFGAQLDGRDAMLTWRTLSETNNDRFEIEHAAPGQSYQTIGTREGQGTTDQPTNYSFRVADLDVGTHQFRLRQIDIDGTPTLSSIERVTVGTQGLAVIAPQPHPVVSSSTIGISVEETSPVTVELHNLLGQRVRTLYDGTLTPGRVLDVEIDAQELPSGTYFVRTTSDLGQNTQRVAVVR